MKRAAAQCPRKTWPRCEVQLVAGGRWRPAWCRPTDAQLDHQAVTVVLEDRGYRTLPAERVRLLAAA
jgi:hypothetical protein